MREDAARASAESIVDGFCARVAAAAVPAAIIGVQTAVVVGVTVLVYLARQALQHNQAMLCGPDHRSRARHFLADGEGDAEYGYTEQVGMVKNGP